MGHDAEQTRAAATEEPAPEAAARGGPDAPGDPDEVLRFAMRIGVAMLSSGAQSDEVEDAVSATAKGFGLAGVQAVVTFSTISVSYYTSPDLPPATLLHLVRDRRADFGRLAAASGLVRRVHDSSISLEAARTELDRITAAPPRYGPILAFLAPALSAGGAAVVFGGDWEEVAATVAVALATQFALRPLSRSRMQPFFRAVISAGVSTLLVALIVGLGLPVSGGLVLTGSLLRFLPGYALVSGFRDLLGESILSGTARVAEAVLLGAGIASGVAIGLSVAGIFGVDLEIVTIGQTDHGLLVALGAAFVLVAGFAIWLGEPPATVGLAAIIGATGWLVARPFAAPFGPLDPNLALLAATIVIGALGRVAARRRAAPPALWVVPAIMPLLPGLQLVQAMLGADDAARITGLVGAATGAFLIGTGVASGDMAVQGILRVRDGVVAPAVGAVVEGVDTLVLQPATRAARPVARAVRRPRPADPAIDEPAAATDVETETDRG